MTAAYHLLSPQEASRWASEHLSFFPAGAELRATEIGDGNLNYVFQVVDQVSGRSVVLKQSGDTARISDQFKVSPDRNRIEYEILVRYNKLVPGLVPQVYAFDPNLNLTAMEDLSDHTILRKGWQDGGSYPQAPDDLAEFLSKTLVATSDGVLGPREKKALVQGFTNPDLCEITEDLVFTEPFLDNRLRNDVLPGLKSFVEKELYGDLQLRLEAAKLKAGFLSSPQALVHGDFHTGSIFVRGDSTKIIDPEFAFFGPAGFDLGALAANAVFAYLSARAEDRPTEAHTFLVRVVDRFIDRWKTHWAGAVSDPLLQVPGYSDWVLEGILRDAAGSAGLELCRRTVGIAHVRELTDIEDLDKRLRVERASLRAGKALILGRDRVRSGAGFLRHATQAAAGEGLC